MASNNVHTARVIEYLPRILQIAHGAAICKDNKGIPKIELGGCEPDACRRLCLTPMEADLVIDRVLPGGLLDFHHSYLPTPVLQGVLNIVVRQWNRIYGRYSIPLTPYQSEDRYCPSIWIGSIYAPNQAILYGPRAMLYLEDRGGSVYEFPLSDVGTKLIPVIEESYLV